MVQTEKCEFENEVERKTVEFSVGTGDEIRWRDGGPCFDSGSSKGCSFEIKPGETNEGKPVCQILVIKDRRLGKAEFPANYGFMSNPILDRLDYAIAEQALDFLVKMIKAQPAIGPAAPELQA